MKEPAVLLSEHGARIVYAERTCRVLRFIDRREWPTVESDGRTLRAGSAWWRVFYRVDAATFLERPLASS